MISEKDYPLEDSREDIDSLASIKTPPESPAKKRLRRETETWIPDESVPPTCFKSDNNQPLYFKGKLPEISLDDCMTILSMEYSKDYICVHQPLHVQDKYFFSKDTGSFIR
ncbi:uncharacterized protein LOC110239205 [Exaiptasia diaphana]|uniref:Uncharacterized protein n=1 Tax=Exaiptasia diaphana TaxID=2652724 RepID=A0A913YKM8_EXADI|nr:uncharacterized protein LOC110239205 [Exaiptasia diaphana]